MKLTDCKRSLNLGREMFPSGATATRLADDPNVRTVAGPSDMDSRTLLPLTMRFELKGRPPSNSSFSLSVTLWLGYLKCILMVHTLVHFILFTCDYF